MKAYSEDLRKKIVEALCRGTSKSEAARLFGVSLSRALNTTLLASMTLEGMGPCLAVVGPTTREVFETYVERVLAPELRPGQVVVMDNLLRLTRVRR